MRHLLKHPVGHRVGWIQHGKQGLVLGSAALGRDRDVDLVSGAELGMDDRRRVIARVGALECRVRDDRGAQLVAGIQVGRAYPGIDHRLKILARLPANLHADLHEHDDDAGVLADGPVAQRAQPRVGQDLRDRIARRRALLHVIRPAHRKDEVRRVVVGDVLQRVGDASNQVLFTNDAHGFP